MASVINPVFRSANLIRRTVSHLFHPTEDQLTRVIVPPFPPNQSLQLTAGRFDTPPQIMKTQPLQSTLVPASGS
jgi:hypothetical protein